MIRRMALACTTGRMAESTRGGGTKANSMDWVSMLIKEKRHSSMVCGNMGSALDGLTTQKCSS